jgi:hypothetical protein
MSANELGVVGASAFHGCEAVKESPVSARRGSAACCAESLRLSGKWLSLESLADISHQWLTVYEGAPTRGDMNSGASVSGHGLQPYRSQALGGRGFERVTA